MYDQYTEVYSISDLHLTAGARVDMVAVQGLATTIRALAARASAPPKPHRAALVINGDIVDFLDIEPYRYFDPVGAPGKLEQVFASNALFWTALQEFAKQHTVVLGLGNHDIELAMPTCQAMLRQRIGGSLVFAFDGAGYRCQVGSATALFLHGNNEDEWNVVDVDALGQAAACVNRGVSYELYEVWAPNEGTKLVIEWLNQAKANRPFLEFLKPEGKWLGVLMSKLGLESMVGQIANIGPRWSAAKSRYAVRSFTAEAAYLGDQSRDTRARLLDGNELMLHADRKYREGDAVLASKDAAQGSLGMFSRKRESDEEIRTHVARSLAHDDTFKVNQSDDIYDRLGPKLGDSINFVVCGHTHLRRALAVNQSRAYFNSGTWMRLLDLKAVSQAREEFPQVLKALEAATRAELDGVHWMTAQGTQQPLVLRKPTVVILSATDEHKGWLADGAIGAAAPTFGVADDSERKVLP